jgi:uncharacterized protein YdaU (DUF1376 family)
MNYFPFHIGDFDRATRHLTRIERSIYVDLILLYYDTEKALTADLLALCRKVVARTDDEKIAVTAVLAEFFIETPLGWFHERCEEVIADYRKNINQASLAGQASAKARAERKAAALAPNVSPTGEERRLNENPTDVERSLNRRLTDVVREANGTSTEGQPTNNQEPITNNQKSKKNKSAPPAGDADLFPGVDAQVVSDFKALRAKKRATVTVTAMQEIAKQAELAGMSLGDALRVCCSRGWSGFKAEWVATDRRQGGSNGAAAGSKFNVSGIDHSSTRAAAEASIKKHRIVIPDGEIEF